MTAHKLQDERIVLIRFTVNAGLNDGRRRQVGQDGILRADWKLTPLKNVRMNADTKNLRSDRR